MYKAIPEFNRRCCIADRNRNYRLHLAALARIKNSKPHEEKCTLKPFRRSILQGKVQREERIKIENENKKMQKAIASCEPTLNREEFHQHQLDHEHQVKRMAKHTDTYGFKTNNSTKKRKNLSKVHLKPMEPSNSKPKSQNTTSKELQDEYKNEQSISAQPSGDQQNSYISDTPSTEQIHEPQNTYDSGDAQSPRKSSPPDTYISDQSNSQNTEQTNELTNEPPLERVQLTFPLPESQSGENEDINDSALNEQNATGNETDTTENNSKEETDEKDKSESLESDFLLMQ